MEYGTRMHRLGWQVISIAIAVAYSTLYQRTTLHRERCSRYGLSFVRWKPSGQQEQTVWFGMKGTFACIHGVGWLVGVFSVYHEERFALLQWMAGTLDTGHWTLDTGIWEGCLIATLLTWSKQAGGC